MAQRLNHARYISSHSDFVYDPGPEWDRPFSTGWARTCRPDVVIGPDPTSRYHAMCVARLLVGNPDTDPTGRRHNSAGLTLAQINAARADIGLAPVRSINLTA